MTTRDTGKRQHKKLVYLWNIYHPHKKDVLHEKHIGFDLSMKASDMKRPSIMGGARLCVGLCGCAIYIGLVVFIILLSVGAIV